MTNETREIEPQSPFFSGWRKAVLWLIGAGALAAVGYRGTLGTETAVAAPSKGEVAPAIVGEDRPARPPPATSASSAAKASAAAAPATAIQGRSPDEPAPRSDGTTGARPRSVEPGPATEAVDGAAGERAGAVPPVTAITPDGKVVLNLATETELQKLPGIGKARARAILEQRERLGRFRRLEDLLRVKGIGRKRLAALRTKVVLDAP